MKRMNTKFNSPIYSFCFARGVYLIYALLVVAGSMLVVNEAFGQTTNTWTGSAMNNDWHDASNWSLNAAPSLDHDIVIDTDADIDITASTVINTLTITSSANVSFTAVNFYWNIIIDNTGSSIEAGSSLTLKGSSVYTLTLGYSGSNNTMSIAGSLILTAYGGGGIYLSNGSETTVTGLLKNDLVGGGTPGILSSTSSNLTFASGGTYEHALTEVKPIPTATWNAGSICKITGATTSLPSGLSQAFGTLNIDSPGYSGASFFPFSGMTIAGDLIINNTGSGVITLSQPELNVGGNCILSDDFNISSSSSKTLNVAGDLTINNGTIKMSTGSSAIGTVNVSGDVSLTGGTITETGGSGKFVFNKAGVQTFTSGSTLTSTINYVVNSGTTLQMATPSSVVESGGTFQLLAGATLGVTSEDGIATSGATGNIRTPGRIFSTGSHLIYNGSADQSVGNGLANTNKANLTIDNSGNTVTLEENTTITGVLTVTEGSTFDLSIFNLGSPTNIVLEGGAATGSAITGTGLLTLGGNITVNDAAGVGTGGASISAPLALGANRTITVADDGSGATDLAINAIISGAFGVTKAGDGALDLAAANTYTGTTTISGGTLRLANGSERIANNSKLILGGGSFSTGETTGFSETVSTLKLTDDSSIDLGTGDHTLTFANSSGESWTAGKVLTVTGWTGTIEVSGGGTAGKIQVGVGGLTSSQLAQITFSGFSPGAVITGSGEVVPKAKLFYSKSSSAPETPGNWNTERDGTGTDALVGDFASAGTFFIVQGSGNGGTTPHTMTTSAAWSVSGVGSKIQIEDGATLASPVAITVASDGLFQIDNGGFYYHQNTSAWSTTIFQGSEFFGSTSTVEINKTSTVLACKRYLWKSFN